MDAAVWQSILPCLFQYQHQKKKTKFGVSEKSFYLDQRKNPLCFSKAHIILCNMIQLKHMVSYKMFEAKLEQGPSLLVLSSHWFLQNNLISQNCKCLQLKTVFMNKSKLYFYQINTWFLRVQNLFLCVYGKQFTQRSNLPAGSLRQVNFLILLVKLKFQM